MTVAETMRPGGKDGHIDPWNRVERPETDPHKRRAADLCQGVKPTRWRKNRLDNQRRERTGCPCAPRHPPPPKKINFKACTISQLKNNLVRRDHRPKCKTKNFKNKTQDIIMVTLDKVKFS